MEDYSKIKEQLEIDLLVSKIKSNQIKNKLIINILQAAIAILFSFIASFIYEKTALNIEEGKKGKIFQTLESQITALSNQKEQTLSELNELIPLSEKLKSKKALQENSKYPGVYARVERIGRQIKLLLTISGKEISDVKAYFSNNNDVSITPGATNDINKFKDSIEIAKLSSNETEKTYIYSIGPFMNIFQNEPIWVIVKSEGSNFIYTVSALTK